MATTTIYFGASNVAIDMPSATTVKYAAKRVAEHLGLPPYKDWKLHIDRIPLPDDALIDDYSNHHIQYLSDDGA